ncbi:MmpS family transport accessory protein, partial [Pseudonocardia petroleophila]|uniref:MmpS family transport accessory protein n=1 Tax=Pseudonocardia petroleophila TaxID=37331 RepID=UPI0035ECBDAA
ARRDTADRPDRPEAPARPGGRRLPDAPRRARGHADPEGSAPDRGTARALAAAGSAPGAAPGTDGPDDTAGDRPARDPGRRRTARGTVPAAPWWRRRWVIGAAAAVVVAVPIALVVVGGADDVPEPAQTGGTVAFGTPDAASLSGVSPTADPAAAAQPAAAEVTLEVTGSGSVGALTYSRGTSVAQLSGAELPWEKTFPAGDGPAEYSVAAAGASGEISCRIVADGVVLAEQTDGSAVFCGARG